VRFRDAEVRAECQRVAELYGTTTNQVAIAVLRQADIETTYLFYRGSHDEKDHEQKAAGGSTPN
jgi:hypothetical protein